LSRDQSAQQASRRDTTVPPWFSPACYDFLNRVFGIVAGCDGVERI
jgi:hypothetical protein